MWFATSSKPEPDKPEPDKPEPELQWPPVFEAYPDFKADLDAAIQSHPPFGEWLRLHRNVNHLIRGSTPVWNLSVEGLKEHYVKQTKLETRTKNAKRAIAELHLECNAQKYQEAQEEFDAKEASYKYALEKYEEAKKHGYRVRAPSLPEQPAMLIEKAALKHIVQEM